jgi:hypothetical protein
MSAVCLCLCPYARVCLGIQEFTDVSIHGCGLTDAEALAEAKRVAAAEQAAKDKAAADKVAAEKAAHQEALEKERLSRPPPVVGDGASCVAAIFRLSASRCIVSTAALQFACSFTIVQAQ